MNYVSVPQYTTINEIKNNNLSLSATQHKKLNIKNKNTLPVAGFLDRELIRGDLGDEVGSDNYVNASPFIFIKTKALQEESYLISETGDATEFIKPQSFRRMKLVAADLLISKDSNVGEIAILDKDYPNAMLCGGIYKLPVSTNKFYLLAFIKHEIFRQQIDFLVPRGSTIRHGKTKFLECKIPMPNKNANETICYVEIIMQAIINKEIAIRRTYEKAMKMIQGELEKNQKSNMFSFTFPKIEEIASLERMDSALFSEAFKKREFLITNYNYGYKTADKLGFSISRGQNLQISNIGKSIQTSTKKRGYYTLVLPNYISKYGTIDKIEYLGNPNKLKTLQIGDVIFGAEGNEKGRSIVVFEKQDNAITNIHGITLNQRDSNISKSVFIKLFLDYYRAAGMIDAYAVGGNGGSMAIKYWDIIKFPSFPNNIENAIVKMYYNGVNYDTASCTLENFLSFDEQFNNNAGIYELDKSRKRLQANLDNAIRCIADDSAVDIIF